MKLCGVDVIAAAKAAAEDGPRPAKRAKVVVLVVVDVRPGSSKNNPLVV